jgi:hypothetical protein
MKRRNAALPAQADRRSVWRWLASLDSDEKVVVDRWAIVYMALTVGTALFAIRGSLVGLTMMLLAGIAVTLFLLVTRRGEA